MSSKKVVVVGGGYAGIQFAQNLAYYSPTSQITLIEKLPYTYHSNGMPRALVDPSYVPKLFIPLDKALPNNVQRVQGIAEKMTANSVHVRVIVNGELQDTISTFPFDYLVIATGSSYPSPIKVPSNVYTRQGMESVIYEASEAIAKADSIGVIGGGSVGCEIAGEIACAYPAKKVSLIDSNDKLVSNSNLTDNFQTQLAEKLNLRGVNLVLGERLVEPINSHSYERKTLLLSKGTEITCDVQLLCVGTRPNTSLASTLDPELVSPRGIKVQANLQLDDSRYGNIYVIGDASNHESPKTTYIASNQAKFLGYALAQNIEYGTPIKPFAFNPTGLMVVPIGPSGGVAQLPVFGGIVLGDWFVWFAKSTDYFASRMWALWNAKVPHLKTMVKKVVVIGGGVAGIQFAQVLAGKLSKSVAQITVIEKQTFTFHAIGMPRALVDKSFIPKLFIPLDKALPSHVTLIHGVAESLTDHDVVVRSIQNGELSESTQTISFDYVVLATGSSYPSPIKVANDVYSRKNIEASIAETNDRIDAASSIMIVGGGSVGCEVAGEIASAYPDKQVTIVDAQKQLIANAQLSDKFRAKLVEGLERRGVKIVLGERLPERLTAHSYERKTFILSNGTEITSDVQLVCAGMKPNFQLIGTLDPTLATAKGIKVHKNLQVEGYSNIYVIGDASNHKSPKMAMVAGDQAKFLGKALAKKIKKGKTIQDYVPSATQGMLIPLGRDGGVAQLPLFGRVFAGDWLVKGVKGKDYFASMSWSNWNATIPNKP
ncbi:pyridine nucleotide-disulfide oxidoreductase [Thraustotheca clavata]|uniref:Pyridine nucleotide-disulfide oxidoreductase n=1 Tax=Thraustotheca clavata TaxID=74557 RepID=A0A1W0A5H6_9STRA|nr:pyridine nucleotide-disulfide oxidoreductase [Thraustotheca clavata]